MATTKLNETEMAVLVIALKVDLPSAPILSTHDADRDLVDAVAALTAYGYLCVTTEPPPPDISTSITMSGVEKLTELFGECFVRKVRWFGGTHWFLDHIYNYGGTYGQDAAQKYSTSSFVRNVVENVMRQLVPIFNQIGKLHGGKRPWVTKVQLRDVSEEDGAWWYCWIQQRATDGYLTRRWRGKR